MGFFSKFTRPAWEKAAERARKAAGAGDHGVAARLFSEAIDRAPDDATRETLVGERVESANAVHAVNFAEAQTRESAGHTERALEHYELAREFAVDDDARARCDEALARLTRERRSAADAAERPKALEEDVRLDDDHAFVVLIGGYPNTVADVYEEQGPAFRSAFMRMQRGELDAALETLEDLATDDNPAVWTEIGRCRRGAGDFDGASEAFAKAETAAPEWNHVRLLWAESCLAGGDLDTVEEVLQRAVDFDDEDPAVYALICRTAIARNEPGYGLEAAEAGLEIAPTDRALRLYQARLFELDGQHEPALAGYEKRIQETWRYDAQEGKLFLDYDAAFFAAHLYRRLGIEPKRAAELFRGLTAVCDPGDRWQHEIGLADVLLLDGKDREAQAILTELERAVPEEQALARCRVAELRGDADTLAARLAALNEAQTAAWEQAQAERQGR